MTGQLISIKLKWSSLIKKIFQLLWNNLGAVLSWLGSRLLERSLDSQNMHQKRAKHSALKDPLWHEQIQNHVFDLRARLVFFVSDPKEKMSLIILILVQSLKSISIGNFFYFPFLSSHYILCVFCVYIQNHSQISANTLLFTSFETCYFISVENILTP